MHQNIAGLLSKKEALEMALLELTKKNEPVDLLCLSEIFVKQHHELNIHLKGFNLSSIFCRPKKRGGVCILHNSTVNIKQLPFVNNLSSELTFECCGAEIVNHKIILVCIYRTPSSDIRIFFEKLPILLDKLKSEINKSIVLTGDWNIDTLKDTKTCRELKTLIESYNLDLHITTPTRRKACLDHFASNIEGAQGYTLPLSLSDHETAQLLTVPVNGRSKISQHWFKNVRDFHPENINKFKQYLSSYSWSEVFQCGDIEKAFNYFHTELCLLYNLCFPKYRVRVDNEQCKLKWVTKGIKRSSNTKRKLRIMYYKTKLKHIKTNYKNYTKLFKKCLQYAQRSKNIEFINKSTNKCRATWRVINNDQSNIKLNTINNLKLDNNSVLKNPTQIASTFNQHFIDIPNLNCNLNLKNYPGTLKHNTATIFLTPTDENEIKNIIQSLNNTKSTGYDELCTKIIKECKEELSPVLSYLVNLSFETGIFPPALKVAIVKPLFKKGETDQIGNYRPITLISILAKIFGKVFYKRLYSFCSKFNILHPEQYGFLKGKSTAMACFKIIEKISNFMDKRIPVSMVLFDLSRAFDCVCHKTLLWKLETYGIRGKAHDWIKSYLSGRVQGVEINTLNENLELTSYKSDFNIIKYGVPQGSILGPLLFNLYINDIISITNYQCTLYADDISIIINKNRNLDYENEINNTIKNIINWLKYNNLNVNINKTKLIQFFNINGKSQNICITYNGEPITECNSVKFLGIDIDSMLTWKDHISNLCKKINRFSYALYRLTKLANQNTALTAYHAYVSSILRYGLLLWGNSVDVGHAFLIQKKCIRAMCGVGPLESCKPLFKKLKILTLTSMYIYEICVFTKNNLDMFSKKGNICNFRTRYPNRLVAPQCSTTSKQRNSFVMCTKIYNKLPDHFKELPLNLFKKSLFNHLCQKCFYNINEFMKC